MRVCVLYIHVIGVEMRWKCALVAQNDLTALRIRMDGLEGKGKILELTVCFALILAEAANSKSLPQHACLIR